jgi:type VI secretion system secreted protein VgrG
MDFTQEHRPIAISTSLGEDALLLTRFTYAERLNDGFTIQASVQSSDKSVSFDDLLGTPASIRMKTGEGDGIRYFHGIIDEVREGERGQNLMNYELTIVPWFAMLKKTSDAKIFQNKSVVDIVKEVLDSNGCPQAEIRLAEGDYPKLEFCVQYLESSYAFVCRLLERAGIAWFFKHEKDRHTLVLTDSVAQHKTASGYEAIPYRESASQANITESISDWTHAGEARTGAWAHTDFDFTNPQVVASKLKGGTLGAAILQKRPHGYGEMEWFDYPGGYTEFADGKPVAKLRLEARQAFHRMNTATATAKGMEIGGVFKLEEHPRDDQNRQYLITLIGINYNAGEFSSNMADGAGGFDCHFTALDVEIPYRPACTTPRPSIIGTQTAIVTGPTGGQSKGEEEIYTDEYGRVKVHFHWDRHNDFDQNSSCWVRVVQVWAGLGFGGQFIPRIGHEVVVMFLNNDPDFPIIIGSTYNKLAKPPFTLPGMKNVSGIRSKTNPEGAPTVNFNEISFDDTKGSEVLHVQAEKDRTILVKHDNGEEVKNDETITIGHDQTMTVGNNRKKHVKADETTNVDGNRTEEVQKDEDITIVGNRTEEVKKNEDITIGENRTEEVKKNEEVQIGGDRTHQIKGTYTLKVGQKLLVDVGEEIVIRAGQGSITIQQDGTVTISGVDITTIAKGEILQKSAKDIANKGSKGLTN